MATVLVFIRSSALPKRSIYLVSALALGIAGCFGGGYGGGGGGGGGTSGPLALPPASSLPAGCLNTTVSAAYTCQITASGGTPDSSGKYIYTWQITGLPGGLSFSASTNTQTVTVTGTVQAQDLVGGRTTAFTVVVKVSDSTGANVSLTYTLNVAPGAPSLTMKTQSPLPFAYVGTAYSTLIEAQGGTTPYSFSLASGSSTPPGLTFTQTAQAGTVAGTPTTAGTYTFTVKVTDSSSPSQSVSQAYSLTVNQQVSLNCSGVNLSLSLCGNYGFEMYGFNSSGGPTSLGGSFAANSSGSIVAGEVITSDSVNSVKSYTVTGGTYAMDASADGRGMLILIGSSGAIATFRFIASNQMLTPIEQFDGSGTLAEGELIGPETEPVTPIPANTILAVPMAGANGSGQKTGLLGLFLVGVNGCDGSSGSFNSYESFVTNTAGTVNTGLTATGFCTAPDTNGVGTVQFTISGGTPFSDTTLHFMYVNLVVSGAFQGAFFLETDPIGGSQPLMVAIGTANSFFGESFGGYCPCLFGEQGTTDGTIGNGVTIASITRLLSSGTTTTGTLTGIIDQNAAGTITSQGTWPFTSYSIDGNGLGTFTGTGQKPIHVILGGGMFWTLDESRQVRTGSLYTQNATSIYNNGSPYIFGSFAGWLTTRGPGSNLGVVTGLGTTAGNFSGTVDFINGAGSFPGTTVSGSYGAPAYTSLDSTTGRGTGVVTFTNGNASSSTNVVIYALRRISFLVLDVQSSNPDVGWAR